jgi:hypothetical protein
MSTTLKAIAAGNSNVATKWQEIAEQNIVSIVASTKTIKVSGAFWAGLASGDKFTLTGTAGGTNDGAYVVETVVNYDEVTTVTAPAADDATGTGTSALNRVPVSTDEIDLNGYSMVQAGGDFEVVAIVDVATGGLFTITDTFTVTRSVTDAALYCNATVDTISIYAWYYSGSGSAITVGAAGNITSISIDGSSTAIDMDGSTGSALTNAGTIGTYSAGFNNGYASSNYMIKNTGDITTISGYGANSAYGIHNNGGTIGDISLFDSPSYYTVGIYNEAGTIGDISGFWGATTGGTTLLNKGTITTITGGLTGGGTYVLYNDGGTIGDITGTGGNKGIIANNTGVTGIYNTSSGTIGNVASVYMDSSSWYGVYIDSGSIGDVTIYNYSSANPSYGLYNAGSTSIGYLTIDGSAQYGESIANAASDITYTGAVSGAYHAGFWDYGSVSGVIVDVDFSGTVDWPYIYWTTSTGEFTGTINGNGGLWGCVIDWGGTFTFSGEITTSGSYGLYLDSGASGTFNGTVTNNGGGAGVYNLGDNVINTTITNTSSGVGYWHASPAGGFYSGGFYSGVLTNTGSGDAIRIDNGATYDAFLSTLSGIVTSTNGVPINTISGYGVGRITGTVSYTPNVPNLSAANIKKDTVILGVTGSMEAGDLTFAQEAARNTDPGIANVKKGTSYKIIDTAKVGTLVTQHSNVFVG